MLCKKPLLLVIDKNKLRKISMIIPREKISQKLILSVYRKVQIHVEYLDIVHAKLSKGFRLLFENQNLCFFKQ